MISSNDENKQSDVTVGKKAHFRLSVKDTLWR